MDLLARNICYTRYGRKTGPVSASESILSKIPPCPGIALPVSLIPISLLIAETTTSPMKPVIAITRQTIRISISENGVKKRKKYPTITVVITPPISPSQVLFGLTLGIILYLPNNLPQVNWKLSFISVINTMNNKSALPPTSNPSISGNEIRKSQMTNAKYCQHQLGRQNAHLID